MGCRHERYRVQARRPTTGNGDRNVDKITIYGGALNDQETCCKAPWNPPQRQ
jgi:hypothetical protein